MNVDKWELDPEVAKNKSINFKDKKTAWEVMFPKESIEVKKTNDEYQFFTGQFYFELKRILNDNELFMYFDFMNL